MFVARESKPIRKAWIAQEMLNKMDEEENGSQLIRREKKMDTDLKIS